MFFALFIVTLFTASFSLGRYSSVQSSESNYDDDFEYTLYDSIVVNTIDEFFAAISNGYNYIIIGDAIKDPLIIAGSMSDIRDDLIIDLNGHEIQRNSRDPLLNVTTGFALTIIDSEGTGSMYNPVGSVIQVSGGTLTVQNGIFESGPRSDDSRDAKRHNNPNADDYVNVNDYNEYVKDTPDGDELYSTPGGGSISATNGTAQGTVYSNPIIYGENGGVNSPGSADNYGNGQTAKLPIITPKTVIRYPDAEDDNKTVISGSMYFDSGTWDTNKASPWYPYITNDTYLYYTYEAENMQFSEAADKSTANYYYQYEDENLDTITVYVYNDVKKYANNGYYPVDSSSDNTGFGAVKMQEGNLYVRGGTYYSYFGEENTYCVESTGGLMSVNPTGTNAINFYAYQNGVCVECTVDKPTENEMLNISNGNFYSELGDTVRVENGNLVIGTADFTKDVSANMPEIPTMAELEQLTDKERTEKLTELYSYNNSVVNISGGTLNINTRATFNVYGSGVTGIRASSQAASSKATVNTNNATFNFYGAGNSKLDASFTRGVYTDGGSVTFDGTTNINLAQISVDGQSLTSRYNVGVLAGSGGSVTLNGNTDIVINGNDNPSGGNYGIYSTGGTITCGQNGSSSLTTIKIAENSVSTGNYGIYSGGGSITTYGTTQIALGNTTYRSTQNYGIYSSGGTVTLGAENSQADKATITVNGDSSSSSNFGIQTIGGHIYTYGTTSVTVYGTNSTGVYATVPDTTSTSSINISGTKFECYIHMGGNEISSTAVSTEGGQINFEVANADITSDGFGITASNTIYVDTNDDNVADTARPVASSESYNPGLVQLTAPENTTTTPTVGLTSNNGTAIYIYGGELLVNSGITLNVNSTIRPYGWASRNNTVSTTNGIYIVDGSFTSHGTVNITNEVTGTWQYGDNRDDNMFSAGGIANTNVSNFNGIFIDGGSFESSDAENSTAKASLGLNNSISATYQIWEEGHWSWEVGWVPEGYSSVDTWYSFNNSSYSGIYVNGGSFTATGTGQITVGADRVTGLYVSHQGVQNDDVGEGNNENTTADNAYYAFNIKSYAVRVEADETNTANPAQVTITKGTIINQTIDEQGNQITGSGGGGIAVQGGTVKLGVENSKAQDVTISTTGTSQYDAFYKVPNAADNWSAKMPQSGGHAVSVSNGSLYIYSGRYTSALGNGIIVAGGDVEIRGGKFEGADIGVSQNNEAIAGAAASYAFKMVGAGLVKIYDGLFGYSTDDLKEENFNPTDLAGFTNKGSGAFVMGTSSAKDDLAEVYMYGGTINVAGATGFAVYRYADVTFGELKDNAPTQGPEIFAESTAITLELCGNSDSSVTIYSGTFKGLNTSGGKNAIWWGESGTDLLIYSGTFTGTGAAITGQNRTYGSIISDRSSALAGDNSNINDETIGAHDTVQVSYNSNT